MNAPGDRSALAHWIETVKLALEGWWRDGGFWRWTARGLWIFCILVWARKMGAATEAGDEMLVTFGNGLIASALLLIGAMLLAPTLVAWMSRPIFRFIDSIYLGGHAVERPPLNYDVAERRVREQRWQDAAAEFERIAYWHPKEERAWNEAIRCTQLAGDTAGAAWLYRRARLRCPTVRPPVS
jgi:hypothetical protein